MNISHHDYKLATDVVVDYPDSMIQPLVEYMVRGKRWEWDPAKMLRMVDKLKTKMFQYRGELHAKAVARTRFEAEVSEYIDQQIPEVLSGLVAQGTGGSE